MYIQALGPQGPHYGPTLMASATPSRRRRRRIWISTTSHHVETDNAVLATTEASRRGPDAVAVLLSFVRIRLSDLLRRSGPWEYRGER